MGVKFQNISDPAEESDMFVQVCIEITSGSLERDVFVNLQTQDDSAIAGEYIHVCTLLCVLLYVFSICVLVYVFSICSLAAVIIIHR